MIKLLLGDDSLRFMPVGELKGGEILGNCIMNSKGMVLMREGSELSPKMIGKLSRYGIRSVYIKDPEMEPFLDETITDVIDIALRNKSVENIKTSFEKFENQVKKQKRNLKYGNSGILLCEGLKKTSMNLIKEILTSKNTNVNMLDIKSIVDYRFEHSVNVAVLSIIIGVEMGLELNELEDLTYGALLMDIGFSRIDDDIVKKEGKLNQSEQEAMREHVKIGYSHINENTTFNAHVKSILMHHHERIDGSGYPNGIKGDEIHYLAKIVMIADVYDALTSDRSYRPAYNPHEAIEHIMANAGVLYDFDIARIFARKVIPYPVGTYVLLSNSQKGVITMNNSDHPLRPKLRTFGKSSYTSVNKISMDLLEKNNVTIHKVVYSLN